MKTTIDGSQLPKSGWAAVIPAASLVGLLTSLYIWIDASFSADHTGLYTVSDQVIATLIACIITALDIPAVRELRKMRRGIIRKTDPEILITALAVNSFSLVIIVSAIVTMVHTRHYDETFGLRDCIANDIVNISADAYQYRNRPVSEGGGGGSYVGYRLPSTMSENEYAKYTIVLLPDSVLITGTSLYWGQGTTVTETTDTSGQSRGFKYTGKFAD